MTLRLQLEQRIQRLCPEFREVAGASGLDAILTNPVVAPGCYLFREAEDDKLSEFMPVRQLETVTIGIVVITNNVRGKRGADSSDDSEALCALIRQKLLGWMPEGYVTQMQKRGGRLIGFKDGYMRWLDRYSCNRYIQQEANVNDF